MFKKENLPTTITLLILVVVVVLGVWGTINKKSQSKDGEEVSSVLSKTETDMEFNMQNQPLIGKENAKAQLVLFTDYSCPHCAQWETEYLDKVEALIKENEDISLRFVNYQFMSQMSVIAGIGGEIVYEKSPENYVKYSKTVLSKQLNMDKDFIVKNVVANTELTKDEVEKLMEKEVYMDRILSDKQYAINLGVSSTPALYLNGKAIENAFDIEDIEKQAKKAIKEAKEKAEGDK